MRSGLQSLMSPLLSYHLEIKSMMSAADSLDSDEM